MTSPAQIAATYRAGGTSLAVLVRDTGLPLCRVKSIIRAAIPEADRREIKRANIARGTKAALAARPHGGYEARRELPTPAQIAAGTREILAARLAGMRGNT